MHCRRDGGTNQSGTSIGLRDHVLVQSRQGLEQGRVLLVCRKDHRLEIVGGHNVVLDGSGILDPIVLNFPSVKCAGDERSNSRIQGRSRKACCQKARRSLLELGAKPRWQSYRSCFDRLPTTGR
jgi:hypothetical protein